MGHWNGFFDLKNLSEDDLKSFFRDSVKLSYDNNIQKIVGWLREKTDDYTVEHYIDNIVTVQHHNVCIDRFAYPSIEANKHGEIGSSCTIYSVCYFLYIYVSLDDLYDLVEKYKLPKRLI
jgi:hypothetical protein